MGKSGQDIADLYVTVLLCVCYSCTGQSGQQGFYAVLGCTTMDTTPIATCNANTLILLYLYTATPIIIGSKWPKSAPIALFICNSLIPLSCTVLARCTGVVQRLSTFGWTQNVCIFNELGSVSGFVHSVHRPCTFRLNKVGQAGGGEILRSN